MSKRIFSLFLKTYKLCNLFIRSYVLLMREGQEARTDGVVTPGNDQTSDKWSSQDKFLVVMETFSMNELELGEYCRKKGLYPLGGVFLRPS